MPTTLGVPNLRAVDPRGVRSLADPASTPRWSLAFPKNVMRVRVGPRQLQVLRLLYTHRLLTAAQVHGPWLLRLPRSAPARSACSGCIGRVGSCGPSPYTAAPAGGRSGYVYGLSAQGAEALATLAGIPLADIPTVAGPEALEARFVNHQLAVNRCLLAVRQACRVHPGVSLQEWTADPHARVRYQVGRSWRTVHPDAVATIKVGGRRPLDLPGG